MQQSTNQTESHECDSLHWEYVDAWRYRLNNYFGNFIDILFNWLYLPFKDFFASVQRASKRDNSQRTPGENTCFELGRYARNYAHV